MPAPAGQCSMRTSRSGMAEYTEIELHEKLSQFISDRFNLDFDTVACELGPVMFESVAAILFDSVVPCRSSLPSSSSQVPLPFPDVAVGLSAAKDEEKMMEKEKGEQLSPYWVSISERTSFRRLHRRGGCWFKAVRMEPVWDLTGLPCNAQCRHCWSADRETKSKGDTTDKVEEDPSVATDEETSSSSSTKGEPTTPH